MPARKERKQVSRRNSGRPTRHASAALTAHVLDTAEALFLSQGFEATSLNQIATKAGATKRTLYVKVGDKAEIFAAVVRRMLRDRQERLNEDLPTGSACERLIRFGDNMLAIALDPKVLQLHRLMVAEAPRFPELATLMEEQMTHGSRERLVKLLRDEVTRGRLVLHDTEIAARLLFIMFIGEPQRAVLFGLAPWEAARSSDWVRMAVQLFYEGCRPITIAGP